MIIDANVAFKWLVDEELSENAARLLRRSDLMAPTILDLEVLQALTRRFRQRLLDRESVRMAVEGLGEARLDLRATYVDCLYLALAIDLDDIMVTADQRFARAVRRDTTLGDRVRALSDF
jgi:predicted nucleic acid-binding protein